MATVEGAYGGLGVGKLKCRTSLSEAAIGSPLPSVVASCCLEADFLTCTMHTLKI